MTKFIVRVVLHDADDSHYDELHEAMGDEGFSKTIQGFKGVYNLPPAEYSYKSNETAEQVRELVAEIADKIIQNSVLVTQATRSVWRNLDKTDDSE